MAASFTTSVLALTSRDDRTFFEPLASYRTPTVLGKPETVDVGGREAKVRPVHTYDPFGNALRVYAMCDREGDLITDAPEEA
jgi:hypothetical protein